MRSVTYIVAFVITGGRRAIRPAAFSPLVSGSKISLVETLKETPRKNDISRARVTARFVDCHRLFVRELVAVEIRRGKSGSMPACLPSGRGFRLVLSGFRRTLRHRCKVIKPTDTVVYCFDGTRLFAAFPLVRPSLLNLLSLFFPSLSFVSRSSSLFDKFSGTRAYYKFG